MTPDLIAAANRVLATFDNGVGWTTGTLTLDRRRSGLWLTSTRCRTTGPQSRRYALRRGDRAWPTFDYGRLGMGGSETIAVAQLVRWVRGMPRRGRRCWEYWLSDTVKLGSAETMSALEAGGYFNPAMTACVICGAADVTDWWSLDGVTGPCCRWGGCREWRSGASHAK